MLLTLTLTQPPATDLGYLLAKNPGRAHRFELGFGVAHVVFPEATEARCTAALVVELDAIGLVRGRPRDDDAPLAQYVNDRAYAASSFLAVALGRVFGTAMSGRSRERQELADAALPFEVALFAVPCRGGERLARGLFEPLGYAVEATPLPTRSEWEDARYLDLRLRGTVRLADLLKHVVVLIPVLDGQKHYWVGDDEVEKLLARGEGWLATHPARDLVVSRYLKGRASLVRDALDRLQDDGAPPEEEPEAPAPSREEALEAPAKLDDLRREAVVAALRAVGAKTVGDLGCGEGKLLARLLRDREFERVVGMDVSVRALEIAHRRLGADRAPARLELLHGSVTYRDDRLKGLDAACLIEVIEHVDEERLDAVEAAVWGHARPDTVVLTTPNAEYNARYENLLEGGFRHHDHRFEWTRAQLAAWVAGVAGRWGYKAEISGIGEQDPALGSPTQLVVFRR